MVFGDIGTSPLYALRSAFGTAASPAVERSSTSVLGLASLVVWAIILVVMVQYVALIMRADNDGEGGVMALVSLILLGLVSIVGDPSILGALSPTWAVRFLLADPPTAFVALGAVVLAVTGAEALYADLGHFGSPPIRRAWLVVVFPALVANYLGQASLVLRSPGAADNPFFALVPPGWGLPMVLLATVATVIASQTVISGTFSLARQAIRLGYLPHLSIHHTSERDPGRVYLPVVNSALAVGVVVLIVAFESSARLAGAYGIAVTGTMTITGMLFLFHSWVRGGRRGRLVAGATALLLLVDLTFLSATLLKIPSGGWVPLVVAAAAFTVMANWHAGHRRIRTRRAGQSITLDAFFRHIARVEPPPYGGSPGSPCS